MSRRLRALAKWTELSSQHSYGASEPSIGLCVVHVQAGKTLIRIIYIFKKGKKKSHLWVSHCPYYLMTHFQGSHDSDRPRQTLREAAPRDRSQMRCQHGNNRASPHWETTGTALTTGTKASSPAQGGSLRNLCMPLDSLPVLKDFSDELTVTSRNVRLLVAGSTQKGTGKHSSVC